MICDAWHVAGMRFGCALGRIEMACQCKSSQLQTESLALSSRHRVRAGRVRALLLARSRYRIRIHLPTFLLSSTITGVSGVSALRSASVDMMIPPRLLIA